MPKRVNKKKKIKKNKGMQAICSTEVTKVWSVHGLCPLNPFFLNLAKKFYIQSYFVKLNMLVSYLGFTSNDLGRRAVTFQDDVSKVGR